MSISDTICSVDGPKDTVADAVRGQYKPQLAPLMGRPGPERVAHVKRTPRAESTQSNE